MIDIQEKVQIGTTSLQIPKYGLGTAHIAKAEEAVAVATVEEALAQGITYIDTAPLYGSGRSELYIGKALAGRPRDSYIISTKVGRLIRDGKPVFDFSRDAVKRSLEESLERLGIDYVDFLLVHDPDVLNEAGTGDNYDMAVNEAFPTLADLRSQGVIKAIGAGMNQWQMERSFARHADVDCFLLAGRYTLLEQTSLDFLAMCQEMKISIIVGGVYNSGILVSSLEPGATYNYEAAPPDILVRAKKLAEVCHAHQVPLNVAAIQFPFAHPAVTAMVVGAEAPNEVIANLDSIRQSIPAALWTDLRDQGLVHPSAPLP